MYRVVTAGLQQHWPFPYEVVSLVIYIQSKTFHFQVRRGGGRRVESINVWWSDRPDGSVSVTPTPHTVWSHSSLVRWKYQTWTFDEKLNLEQRLLTGSADCWHKDGFMEPVGELETTFDTTASATLRVIRGAVTDINGNLNTPSDSNACHHQHGNIGLLSERDHTQVYNLLVNFDAGTIWKIFTIFYWNILYWILWNLDKKCSEQSCTKPNFYLTSRIDFNKWCKTFLRSFFSRKYCPDYWWLSAHCSITVQSWFHTEAIMFKFA